MAIKNRKSSINRGFSQELILLLEQLPDENHSAHRLMFINYLKSNGDYNPKRLRKYLDLIIEEIDKRKPIAAT